MACGTHADARASIGLLQGSHWENVVWQARRVNNTRLIDLIFVNIFLHIFVRAFRFLNRHSLKSIYAHPMYAEQ